MDKRSYLRLVFLLWVFVSTSSYAAVTDEEYDEYEYEYSYASISKGCPIYDPYENFNRKIFAFNAALDKVIFKPLARTYGALTNEYTRARVHSFLGNIKEPLSTVNYSLQGKSHGGLKSFWRFVLNSTLGVGGLFDVASKFGLKSEPQTFSNTLAYYGVGAGPYIVLPVFGANSARDLGGLLAFDYYLDPAFYVSSDNVVIGEMAVRAVHYRQRNLPFTDHVEQHSVDPYIAIRNAVLNERESKMNYPEGYVCPQVNKR